MTRHFEPRPLTRFGTMNPRSHLPDELIALAEHFHKIPEGARRQALGLMADKINAIGISREEILSEIQVLNMETLCAALAIAIERIPDGRDLDLLIMMSKKPHPSDVEIHIIEAFKSVLFLMFSINADKTVEKVLATHLTNVVKPIAAEVQKYWQSLQKSIHPGLQNPIPVKTLKVKEQ